MSRLWILVVLVLAGLCACGDCADAEDSEDCEKCCCTSLGAAGGSCAYTWNSRGEPRCECD